MTSDQLRQLAKAASYENRPLSPTPVKAVVEWTRACQRFGNVMNEDAAQLLAAAADMFAAEHAECVGRFNPRLCNVCQWLAIFAGLDEGGAGPGEPS